MAPGGLGKGRLAEHRTVRQCRIFRKNTDARCDDFHIAALLHPPSVPIFFILQGDLCVYWMKGKETPFTGLREAGCSRSLSSWLKWLSAVLR